MATLYEIPVTTIDGRDQTLDAYRGQVLLVVNVASQCGFTPQYTGLERLQRELGPRGFSVLGFPCNQFGAQEPGDPEEIKSFCSLRYDVSFPIFSKVEVNGSGTHPLFAKLKRERRGVLWTEAIKWNFTKFLVGRDGRVLARFAPKDTPEMIRGAIEKALG
ncbi:MAG: glutathione peroxidase [Gemmatimonadaceae bacterium]|nr:glutathione peroxidase [Gemmatimonadaceae bacterium]MCW5826897.1 glutathione peroxidase [Gemmatimonadaceae bacterium]